MRATVKGKVGVFHPQGFLDGINTPSFLTLDDIKATQQLKVDMLLVSLKKVVFFNKNGLDIFVKLLLDFRSKMRVVIGFCDYDTTKYKAMLKFYDNSPNFSLFKSQKIAELFSSNNKEESKDVLVFNEDASQRSTMAIELFEYGHNPIIAQTKEDFDAKKEDKERYFAIVENTFLGLFGQKIATRVTGNAIIYTVSSFLDAEISDSFNLTYHTNSLNVGFRLFIFDAYKVISMNVHALTFFAKLSSSAAEYNATVCFVGLTFEKTPIKFKEDLEDSGLMFFDTMDDILKNKELLDELGAATSSNVKNKRSLTKLIVNELPNFIDATVLTIEMMTNAKASKESADMQDLHVKAMKESLASSIGFYGDMDGMVILVFPKNIAKKTCELLIGEAATTDEELLDALAELVNIVGGRVKSLLADHNISVDITLPRTYANVEDLVNIVMGKKGVQVNLNFDEDAFTFFLTR